MVCGESGAGKTSFVEAFLEQWRGDERVMWGVCDPLSTPRPLGPIHDLADQFEAAPGEAVRQRRPSLRDLQRSLRRTQDTTVDSGHRRPPLGRSGNDRSASLRAAPNSADPFTGDRHRSRRRARNHTSDALAARRRRSIHGGDVAAVAAAERRSGRRTDRRRPRRSRSPTPHYRRKPVLRRRDARPHHQRRPADDGA